MHYAPRNESRRRRGGRDGGGGRSEAGQAGWVVLSVNAALIATLLISPWQRVHLFLNWLEVEVSFVAKRRVAVWVHHHGNVLVDEAQCEHVAMATLCIVKEADCVTSEVCCIAPQPATTRH